MASRRHERLIELLVEKRPACRTSGFCRAILEDVLGRPIQKRELAELRKVEFGKLVLGEDGYELAEYLLAHGPGLVPDAFELLSPHPLFRSDVAVFRCYEVEVSNPHLSRTKAINYANLFWPFDGEDGWALELILIDRWGVMRWIDLAGLDGFIRRGEKVGVLDGTEFDIGMSQTMPALCFASEVPGGCGAPFGLASEMP